MIQAIYVQCVLSRRGCLLVLHIGNIQENLQNIVLQVFLTFIDDGESGIRTHGDISATLDFESSALDQLSHLSLRECAHILPFSLLSVKNYMKS